MTNPLHVDLKKKQVLLRESTLSLGNPTKLEKGPRLYLFDNIFAQGTSQSVLYSGVLVDLLHAVVNGNNACLQPRTQGNFSFSVFYDLTE